MRAMVSFARFLNPLVVLLPILTVVPGSPAEAQPTLPLLFEMEGESDDDNFGASVSSAGDVNNDGYDDWVIGADGCGADGQGRFYLYLGGSPVDSIPDLIVNGSTEHGGLGRTVASVGDVDGDGYDDFAVTDAIYPNARELDVVRLYLGADTIDGGCDLVLAEPMPFCFAYGHSISHGDFNGDGRDDILIGAFEYDEELSHGVSTDLTETTLTDSTASWESDELCGYCLIPNVNTTLFGHWPYRSIVSNTGTTITVAPGMPLTYDAETGDPYSVRDYRTGAAYVYLGGSPMDSIADLEIHGRQSGSFFGYAVAGVGDVNGDSYGDFMVGAYEEDEGFDDSGTAYLYLGGADIGACGQPHVVVNGGSAGDFLGFSVAGTGDMNGDGFCDFAISVPRLLDEKHGEVLLYYGGWGPDSIPDMSIGGWEHAVTTLVGGGDVNGDFCSDLAVGVPHDGDGKVFLYWGGESPDDVADAVLVGDPGGYGFGNSVACAGDVDRDGDCDVLVGTYDAHAGNPPPYNGKAFLFAGGSPTGVKSGPPLPNSLELEAFPSPFSGSLTVVISGSAASLTPNGIGRNDTENRALAAIHGQAAIDIVDLKGRVVHKDLLRRSAWVRPEDGNASWSVLGETKWIPEETVGSGLYVVRASIGGRATTKRVVLLR
jgi:hypothetical protein